MLPTLLIVDDERATRDGLRSALDEEFDVYTASGTGEALAILKSEPIQLLLTDLRLGGESGMDLLEAALALPEPPVAIMMTAYGSVDTAVEAMRRGAWHFVTKPLNLDEVEMLLKRAARTRSLHNRRARVLLARVAQRAQGVAESLPEVEVDGDEVEPPGLDLREVEQIIDQVEQYFAAATDRLDKSEL